MCIAIICVRVYIQEGKWQHVYVDTQFPCDAHGINPLFARSGQRSELWIMLLEKV
jgi:Calpain family cysteine protease